MIPKLGARAASLLALLLMAGGCGKTNAQICSIIVETVLRCIPNAPATSTSTCVANLAKVNKSCHDAFAEVADCWDGKSCNDIADEYTTGGRCKEKLTFLNNICNFSATPTATANAPASPPPGNGGSFSPTAQEPLEPKSYTVVFSQNYSSTCDAEACPADSTVIFDITYASPNYSIGNESGVIMAPQEPRNNQLHWSTAPSSYTTQAGCAATQSGNILLNLATSSFSGTAVYTREAQACNGYSALTCTCAYSISGT